MDKYQSEASPRELTEEEIKTVSGGAFPHPAPWSSKAIVAAGGTKDGGWRDNK
jgi:hypothetical protein